MLILLTLFLVLPQSAYSGSTLVLPSRVVVIQLPYVNATIPCSYTFPDEVSMTTWKKSDGVKDRIVLIRNSIEKVKHGPRYEGLVSFGEGCSLVFKSARLEDNGNFTVVIHNQNDSSETVRVIVVGENSTVYSSDTCSAEDGKGCEDRVNNTADNKTIPGDNQPEKASRIFLCARAVVTHLCWAVAVVCAFLLGKGDISLIRDSCRNLFACCENRPLCVRVALCLGLVLEIVGGICVIIASCTFSESAIAETGIGLGIIGTLLLVIATIAAVKCRPERNNDTSDHARDNGGDEPDSGESHASMMQ